MKHIHTKSRGTAAILAIFFGTFGIHRFYCGKPTGLLYLLFFFTGLPTILGIVEGITYLFVSDCTFEEYCTKVPCEKDDSKDIKKAA